MLYNIFVTNILYNISKLITLLTIVIIEKQLSVLFLLFSLVYRSRDLYTIVFFFISKGGLNKNNHILLI